jgi:hypothetical protein
MTETQQLNRLYLSVLPLIRIVTMRPHEKTGVMIPTQGQTEQAITLFTDRNFATEFFPDEVDIFVEFFKTHADRYLTGGHVTGYTCETETADSGRVIVKVTQHVR